MDLRALLFKSPKPAHQFHDNSSLRWLSSNRPNSFSTKYKIETFIIEAVDKNKPWRQCEYSWFSNNFIRDGIHGFRHVCRVAIHSIALALKIEPRISNDKIGAIMLAALLHDCRRKNDNADPNHGVRAAKWLNKDNTILPQYIQPLSEAIQFAISVHNDSYDKIVSQSDYGKFKFFVDILKTADALDRYRFPREDWWINSKFITLLPCVENMTFAYDLMLESEILYLKTKDNQRSIAEIWEKLKRKN